LTDILSIHNRDIRSFKKNNLFVKYLEENPKHYLSGNKYTDDFGIKVTYGHPNLALLLLKWLYREENDERKKLTYFINNRLKRVEENEIQENDVEEDSEEEENVEEEEEENEMLNNK
jgi:hypothetical protein